MEHMHAKYPIGDNFFLSKTKKGESSAWQCILKNLHQFGKGIRWKVGHAQDINLWLNNWCANDSLKSLFGIYDYSLIDAYISYNVTCHHKRE